MPKISVSDDIGAMPTALPVFHIAADGRSPAEMKSPRPARNASVAVAPVVNTVTSASRPSSLKNPLAFATWNWTQCSSVPLKIRTFASAAKTGVTASQIAAVASAAKTPSEHRRRDALHRSNERFCMSSSPFCGSNYPIPCFANAYTFT